MRKLILLAGPLILVILALSPPLPNTEKITTSLNINPKFPQIALGILVWTALWWISEIAPLGLTALIPVFLFSLIGVVPWRESLRGFTDPIMWILIGGFVLAKAFQVWGLDKRVAYKISTIYKGDNPVMAAFFIAALPPFILTMTGSITASTFIVYPIVLAYLTSMGVKEGSKYAEATMLTLGQAATAGAMFMLISTPPNLIAKKVIEENLSNFTLTFFDWIIVGTPHAILGLLISWLVIFNVLKIEKINLPSARSRLLREVTSLGPIKKEEKITLAIFLLVLILWLTPGMLTLISSTFIHIKPLAETLDELLPEAAPAVLALILFGLIKIGGRSLLTWKEIEEGIDWNVVFLLGGGLALGRGLDASGFSRWLAQIITEGGIASYWQLVAISAILGFVVTYPASNTASAWITTPIAASLAIQLGFNPVPAVLAAGLACSISSALPSTTPPMAIIYGSKYIKLWNMFKTGMISDMLRLTILIILTPYLGEYLCNLKGIPVKIGP